MKVAREAPDLTAEQQRALDKAVARANGFPGIGFLEHQVEDPEDSPLAYMGRGERVVDSKGRAALVVHAFRSKRPTEKLTTLCVWLGGPETIFRL